MQILALYNEFAINHILIKLTWGLQLLFCHRANYETKYLELMRFFFLYVTSCIYFFFLK